MSVTAVFGAVAGCYASARPDYPPELYAALADLAGRGLDGALVVDVGAGTGIAARQMRDRGAEVIAIEPSAGMLAELARASPGVRVVQRRRQRAAAAGRLRGLRHLRAGLALDRSAPCGTRVPPGTAAEAGASRPGGI